MFADWQLSRRVKRDPQTLNLLHRSDWGASLSSSTVISPHLDLSWCWTESVCRPERTASSKPGNTGTSQRSCCHLYYYYVIFIFGLYMQNVATNQVRLSSLMEAEQEALRGTQHVFADAQSSSTSNWKSVSLFTSLLVPSVWTSHCCAQEQTQTDVCLSVTAQCCGACSPQTVTVSKTITEVIEKQCSLEMFPLIKPSTDSFTRTCSGPTRGLWPYVWHHTLDAFMTPEPWNKWLKTEHFIYLINLLT